MISRITTNKRRRATATTTSTATTILLSILLTTSPSSTIITNAQQTSCTDTPNFTDSFGDTCAYYNDVETCEAEGGQSAGDLGVANDNCCLCGGGIKSDTPPNDTTQQQQTTETAATNAAGEVIVNPGGTCGNGGGDRGNGICENGQCCSKVRADLCDNILIVHKFWHDRLHLHVKECMWCICMILIHIIHRILCEIVSVSIILVLQLLTQLVILRHINRQTTNETIKTKQNFILYSMDGVEQLQHIVTGRR